MAKVSFDYNINNSHKTPMKEVKDEAERYLIWDAGVH